MNNFNLQAPAGQGLGGANLVEMKKEEMREIEGGFIVLAVLAVLYLAGTCVAASQGRNAHTRATL